MYRPIPLEEVIAAMPKKRQEAIAKRGAELVAKVRRRMTLAELRKGRKISQATVANAARTLLTRTADEGALPFTLAKNAAEHNAWFRAKVQEALDDPRPAIPHEEVEAHFAQRRAAARRKEPK